MNRSRAIATVAAVAIITLSAPGRPPTPTSTLTAEQQRILDYMLADWNQPMHVTGIDLAMQIIGGQYTPDDRYAVGTFLRDNPRLHRTLRTFGWETVALTPTEKLIARILSRAEQEKQPPPTLEDLARELEVSPTNVRDGLKMLERFEIIRPDQAAGGVGYRMAEERYVDWEGPMRITFMYHRVRVEGGKPFEVF